MTQDIFFKSVGQEEIDSVAHKFFSFEEPASRFAQIKKILGKQTVGKPSLVKQFETAELSSSFGRLFRGSAADKKIALAMALCDIHAFTEQAFKLWRLSAEGDTIAGDCDLDADIRVLIEDSAVGVRRDWLYFMAQCAPDFSAVIKDCELLSAIAESDVGRLPGLAAKLSGTVRPKLLLLVEGQSELLVLPRVFELCDIPAPSLEIIACGGVQQVIRRYLFYREIVRLPLVCLLDADAGGESEIIQDALRESDALLVLTHGELEDTFDTALVERALVAQLAVHNQQLGVDWEAPREKRATALARLFRQKGLGDFDKVDFASHAASSMTHASDIPVELKKLAGLIGERLPRD